MLHAGVLMKLGAFGILRVAISLCPEGWQYWSQLMAVLATVGIVYGVLVGLTQKDLKYVIGYSSVSHMGIVGLGLSTVTAEGLNGAIFQMFAHGIMTALLFLPVMSLSSFPLRRRCQKVCCLPSMVVIGAS